LRHERPPAAADLGIFLLQAIPTLPAELQPGVVHAYVLALQDVFIIGVAAGAFSFQLSLSHRARD